MKRRVILVMTSVVLVLGLLLAAGACAPAPTEAKTLKIGVIESLNWPIGTDALATIEMDVERTNADGGLLIGGERYMLEIIVDDDKMDLALGKTAAEKQIFEDKVKFIKGDLYPMSYLDLCEENKVVMVAVPNTPEMYDPKYHYLFCGSHAHVSWVPIINWMAERFPDEKSIVFTFPDRLDGHAYQPIWENAAEVAGLTPESIFYPPEAVDLSAVGTKIKTSNPDFLCCFGGGPDMDSMIIKAAYVAGWRGILFNTAAIPGGYFLGIAGPEPSEGIITAAWPAEFDPPLTDMAAEFKADWIAKYGQWTDPEPVTTPPWWILKAALQKASSPDPDEVADIIANGLEFESPLGKMKMISRPDFDNPRTIQVMVEIYMKQLVEGEITDYGYISMEELYNYSKLNYGW